MKIADQQTAAEIRAQIDGVLRELDDIHESMNKLTSTTDLLGARAEIRDRESVVELLGHRLQDAEEREKRQAEHDRRQANEDTMTEAQAAHAAAKDRFKERQGALVRYVTAEMDELDGLRWECQRLQGEFQEAWLRNNPDKRHDSFTWPRLPSLALDDLTEPEGHAQDVLGVLFASRHGLPGNLKDLQTAAMGQANAQFRAMHQAQQAEQAARPPELTRAQEVDLISAEFRAKLTNHNPW